MSTESTLNFDNAQELSLHHATQAEGIGVNDIEILEWKSGGKGFRCGKVSGVVSRSLDTSKPMKIAFPTDEAGKLVPLLCNIGGDVKITKLVVEE